MGTITQDDIRRYREFLHENERSEATVTKYAAAVTGLSTYWTTPGKTEMPKVRHRKNITGLFKVCSIFFIYVLRYFFVKAIMAS